MTIEYFLNALALDIDSHVMNLLIMRGTHIPGIGECILSHMPIVQLHVIDKMPENSIMSVDHMKSGVLWQRPSKGLMPWYPLPVPKGLPMVYAPEPTPPSGLTQCFLKPAHDPEELYVVHVPCTTTVADVLKNLARSDHTIQLFVDVAG